MSCGIVPLIDHVNSRLRWKKAMGTFKIWVNMDRECLIYCFLQFNAYFGLQFSELFLQRVPGWDRTYSLRWRHNERDSVSNHQPHDCLLNRLFRRRSKKTSKLRVTGLCVGNSPGTGEFLAQMASYAENVSIWWRHHVATTRRCSLHYKIPSSIAKTYLNVNIISYQSC